ncbi:MAG: gliding motility-associated C-terminal domain-containing protein [Ferruginibacter sp.]
MKKQFLIACFLFTSVFVFAQKQANIWYFGNRVGLDFNQSPPIALYNGTANSLEGSATMSDNNGKLLFYTNGLYVQNRNHVNMVNGTGLRGELSSTNNTVIVPMPGNDSMYYLFTIGSATIEFPSFSYNIIDMKADNGFGAVILKNALIEDDVLEKVAAIRHCNKRDVWLVIQKFNSDKYYTYLLTSAGLNPVPVISSTALVISGLPNNAIGTLKFSSKGDKLMACHSFDNDAVQLMNFDNQTGIISNPIVFNPNTIPRDLSYPGVYGAEFSADGKLLYISANNSVNEPCNLYQFDITSHNSGIIMASKQIIAQPKPLYAGALQLGPDQKIYMARWNADAVSVINDPNSYGSGCNFMLDKIYVGKFSSTPVQFGLPTFMQSYFDSDSNPYDFSRAGNCFDLNVSFLLNRLNNIDSVKWNFGDAQQSQVLQPTHTYATPGFYNVSLIVYKIDCSGLNDTITRKIWIAASDKFLGADTSSCNTLSLEIGVDEIFGVNYLWNTGSTSNKITTTGFGDYWLDLEQNGCKIRDTIKVLAKPKPVVSLGIDTSICKYKPVLLSTGSSTYDSYLWSTGETSPSIFVDQTGTYSITVTQSGCEASDTVLVKPGNCDIYIPSAFTPNNDNLNETFGVIDYTNVPYFSMQVFNRYGQLIFSSNDITKKWDGTFKDKKMPNGGYFWMVTYVNKRGIKVYDQGMVLLIR